MTLWQGLILNGTEVVNNPIVVGDITMGSVGPAIHTIGNQYLTLYGNGTGYVRIGTGVSIRGLNANNDLVVTNKLEVGANAYMDSTLDVYSDTYLHGFARLDWASYVSNTGSLAFGNYFTASTTISGFQGNNGGGTLPQLSLLMGTSHNRSFIIGDTANGYLKNYDHALQANPTLFVHSAVDPDVANTQWLSLAHDQTDAVISSGKGFTTILAAGGSVNETVRVGTGTAPTYINGSYGNSLYVAGKMEVRETTWFDFWVVFQGGNVVLRNAVAVYFNDTTANNSAIYHATLPLGYVGFFLGTAHNHSLIISEYAWMSRDFDHGAQTNPTLFIQSATDPDVNNTQWMSLVHETTQGKIATGVGPLILEPFISGTNYVQINGGASIYGNTQILQSGSIFGHSNGANYGYVFYPYANGQVTLAIGGTAANTTLNNLVLTNIAWYSRNFDHAASTNPTLFIHSNTDPDVNNTQWLSLTAETTRSLLVSNHGPLMLYSTSSYVVSSSPLYAEGGLSIYNGSYLGTNTYAIFSGYTDDGLHVAMGVGAGTSNYNFIITAQGNSTKDHDHTPASADPTLIIHSATDPDANNTQWVSLTHNQTRPIFASGKGAIGIGTAAALNVMPENVNSLIVSGNIETTTLYAQYTQLVVDGIHLMGPGFALPNRTVFLYGSATLGQFVIAPGSDAAGFGQGNQVIIGNAFYTSNNRDYDHAAQTNPTLYVQSNADPDIDNTQWISMTHDQTNSLIANGKGDMILDPITEITEVCGVGLKTKEYNATLNDDATISLPAGTGWGTFMIGDNQEYARIRWTSAAVVTLDEGTANVALADTDTFFCLYDGGATVTIKNRLGANLTLRYVIHYS